MRRAVFLDRDGVINELVSHRDSLGKYEITAPRTLEEFKVFPRVAESIAVIKDLDYSVFVVTNQPGVMAGVIDPDEMVRLNSYLFDNLLIDDLVCAYDKNSNCYKPKNGGIELLCRRYDVIRGESLMVGDRWKDVVPGHRSGLKTVFIGSRYYCPVREHRDIRPDYRIRDISELVGIVERTISERIRRERSLNNFKWRD